NTKSSVGHDCTINNFTTIAPNATIAGGVNIGEFTTVAISSTIIQGKAIGNHTVIGAGSTVLNDIGSNYVAYGTPAKIVSTRSNHQKYLKYLKEILIMKILLSSPHMGGTELDYINDAFNKNWIAPLGENVNNFESSVKQYTGSKAALALSSGTAAIHLALIEAEVKEDDIVFCSSLTFSASANPIIYQKATPVFIDSEEDTWNMCPKALKKAFEKY